MDGSGNIRELKPDEKLPVGSFKLNATEAEELAKIPKERRVEVLKVSRQKAELLAEQRRQAAVHAKRLGRASVLPKSLRNGKLELKEPVPEKRAHKKRPQDTNASRPSKGRRRILRRIGAKSRNQNR